MFRNIVVALAVILLPANAWSAGKFAPLTGTWIVRWMESDGTNPITLTEAGGVLAGTYKNDKGVVCPITGERLSNGSGMKFTVTCPDWRIEMEGAATPSARMAAGTYLAYGNAAGAFVMTRQK